MVKLTQLSKAFGAIDVMLEGNTASLSNKQSENAFFPIVVTPSGTRSVFS